MGILVRRKNDFDSLDLYYDFTNKKCWDGSSNIIRDLSINNRTGTVDGSGVTYGVEFGGNFTSASTGSTVGRIIVPTLNYSGPFSIETTFIYNIEPNPVDNRFFLISDVSLAKRVEISNDDTIFVNSAPQGSMNLEITRDISVNRINHVIVTKRSDDTFISYLNGIKLPVSNPNFNQISGSTFTFDRILERFTGKVFNIKVYNKFIDDKQAYEHFLLFRNRFGLN